MNFTLLFGYPADVLVRITKVLSDFHCTSLSFIYIFFPTNNAIFINSCPNEIWIEPSDHSSSLTDHKTNYNTFNERDGFFDELNKRKQRKKLEIYLYIRPRSKAKGAELLILSTHTTPKQQRHFPADGYVLLVGECCERENLSDLRWR